MRIKKFEQFINEAVNVSECRRIIAESLDELGYKKRERFLNVYVEESGNYINIFLNSALLCKTWNYSYLNSRNIENLKNKIKDSIRENPSKYACVK